MADTASLQLCVRESFDSRPFAVSVERSQRPGGAVARAHMLIGVVGILACKRVCPIEPPAPLRPTGIYVLQSAHDLKFINLIIHDTGHGFYTENTAHNIEIYGCIIYNGGDQNAASGGRSDGHGIYIKGDGNGWKIVRDNVIFDQFGFGIHGYAESGQALKNLVFDGN